MRHYSQGRSWAVGGIRSTFCYDSVVSAASNSSRPGENSAPECEILPFWPVACERILASVNNSQSPMRRGASHLKKGMPVDFVASDAEGTEIVYQRKHLFADDPLF